MIKKIKIDQLKPGMYVHDLNSRWFHHPFLSRKVKINDPRTITKIAESGIREVYIDTEKGLDVANAPTVEEVNEEIEAELDKFADIEEEPPAVEPTVPIHKEISKAREIKKAAKQTVQSVMEDVRFGRQVEAEKVERVVEGMVDSIFRNQDALMSLARIKQTDEYTFYHSMSVGVLMISFARHMGFDKQLIQEVGVGAMLHDIGKMKVPQDILNKEGKFTEDEYSRIKEHVAHGRNILERTPGISKISISIAAEHHERIDGTGYPDKLQGDEISVFGQMTAIADVYDAMTSDRCYQCKTDPTAVLKKLYEWSKLHYSQDLVQRFIRCVGIYPIGTLVRLESGMLGVVIHHGEKNLLQPVVRVVFNVKREALIIPYDVDLTSNGDRITGYEAPAKWDLNPLAYVN